MAATESPGTPHLVHASFAAAAARRVTALFQTLEKWHETQRFSRSCFRAPIPFRRRFRICRIGQPERESSARRVVAG